MSKARGDIGEGLATNYFSRLGYTIKERNWRFGHCEIDLILERGYVIIFAEVKLRQNNYFGNPEGFVTSSKISKICKAAEAYLKHYPFEREYRFDIISILKSGPSSQLLHIEEAFWPRA